MPILSGSVGYRGRNRAQDVAIVRQLLGLPEGGAGRRPGTDDQELVCAIEEYQRTVLHFRRPDGRVDPGGLTIRGLTKNRGPAKPVAAKARQAKSGTWKAPRNFVKNETAMRQAMIRDAQSKRDRMLWEEFRKAVEKSQADWGTAFGFLSRAEELIKIVKFYRLLRECGMPATGIWKIVPALAKHPKTAYKVVDALATPGGKLGSVMKTVGKAGKIVAFVTTAIQSAVAWDRGDYGHFASLWYKFGMGVAIPWAGFIDGIEGFVSAIWPGAKKNGVWKYLRAANLIGLGTVGVDAAGTILRGLIKQDFEIARLERLRQRMKASPAKVFVEMGEDLDKALEEIHRMPEKEFREALSVKNIFNWLKYELTGKLPSKSR